MDAITPVWHDLRLGTRALSRSPGYAAVVVITLGIGIGAATALFSVVHGVLLRPLPYPGPDRIVQVWEVGPSGGRAAVTDPNFVDWRDQAQTVTAMAQMFSAPASIVGGVEPVRRTVGWVSGDFFQVMGVQPVLGRAFVAEERQPGGSPAVVVSHGFWRDQLESTADLARRTLAFGDAVYQVVGVMPPGFDFPADTELWVPRERLGMSPSRTAHSSQVVARLAPGMPAARAQQELGGIARALKAQYGDDIWMTDAAVLPLQEQLTGEIRPVLLVLLGAAGFLLLVAVANVANLSLARMAAGRRELAVRVALGAGRARLLGQTVGESLAVSLAGAAVGLLLAWIGLRALLVAEPGNLPRGDEIGVSGIAVAFALGAALIVALVLGAAGALWAARADLREGLASGDRGRTGGVRSRRVQDGLVAAQVALTFVLLVGAGLIGRSILHLLDVELGFRTQGVVAMSLSHSGIQDRALADLHEELVTRLRATRGVEEAGGSTRVPLLGGGANGTFVIQNHAGEIQNFDDWGALVRIPERSGQANYRVADEGFFRALRIPLLRGRLFDGRDSYDAPHAAVINESLAADRWPGEDPLGKLINFANMDGDIRPMTIVGVVGDVRDLAIDEPSGGTVYAAFRQRPRRTSEFTYVVAGQGGTAALLMAARGMAAEVAPNSPPRLRTLDEVAAAPLAQRRFTLLLLGVFGATALLLSGLGLYGLVAYGVTLRRREIGIRIALGAAQERVVGMIVRQGAALAIMGMAGGLVAALLLTRYIAHQLYGVGATDIPTFAVATVFLLVVALLASYVPARRAGTVDPISALRED
jgi:putative ABC transport system permease protein